MLRIHDDMLEAIATMRPMTRAIERCDPDLARQLRRAASSVALNIAEGSGSFGRVRLQRYRTALGSARETCSCLRLALAWGYVGEVPPTLGADEPHHRNPRARRGHRVAATPCARARPRRARARGVVDGASRG